MPFIVNPHADPAWLAVPVKTIGTVAPPSCPTIVPVTFKSPGHTAENVPLACVAD